MWLHGAGVLHLSDVAIVGGPGKALLVDDAARAIVDGGSIEVAGGPAAVLRGGTAELDATAIDAWGSKEPAVVVMTGTMLSLVGVPFSGCDRCLVAAGGAVVARGCTFDTAAIAVEVTGGLVDLGGPAAPGGNSFSKVTNTALRVAAAQPVKVAASGNTWIKGAQGAVFGVYSEDAVIEGPLGCADDPPRNFCLVNAGAVVEF